MIGVIGAGPIGNYLALLLAKRGYKVNVFEEHSKIGVPVKCTGITTLFLKDLVKIEDKFLVNTVSRTRVYSPNMDSVEIKLKKNLVIDRAKFDVHLADLAKGEGAKYHLNHAYVACRKGINIDVGFFNKKNYVFDKLIGADGPLSQVAKTNGMYGDRKFVVGHQARVKINCEEDLVEFFLGEGYFGWLVPESNKIARIGVCSEVKSKEYFEKLMRIRKGKTLEWQSGIIPIFNPNNITENDRVYLVGDAATQVKATTFGGMVPGMMAAEELSKAIVEGRSYERLWRKRIGRELKVHLMIRRIMDKFRDKDYDGLIKLVKQERVKDLISKHDREFPIKLLFKMLLREPRFAKYTRFLL